jgi:thymidylate kinase
MPSYKNGKLLTIYGVNGTGKTTQAQMLRDYIISHNRPCEIIKFPVYDLGPTGPFLHQYLRDPALRSAHPHSPLELQRVFVKNRKDYQPQLLELLHDGVWVIAEDYVGTGISWGLAHGANFEQLLALNQDLVKADLSILLNGDRFTTADETAHLNESDSAKLALCKNFLLLMARYPADHLGDYKIINANGHPDEVHARIIDELNSSLTTWQVSFKHISEPIYQ